MEVIDDGHIYKLSELGGGAQTLRFVKRSGGVVVYRVQWPGVQSQEVLRALIHRTKYLNNILPCTESGDALFFLRAALHDYECAAQHLRMALFSYETRAYRRKQEHVNRGRLRHDDSAHPRSWRKHQFEDVPFNEEDIEHRPVGEDGHIILSP